MYKKLYEEDYLGMIDELKSVSSYEELCDFKNSILKMMIFENFVFDEDDMEEIKTKFPEKMEQIDEFSSIIRECRKNAVYLDM